MRIAIVGKSDRSGGGASKYSELLQRAMRLRGHEADFFTLHPASPSTLSRPLFSRPIARVLRLTHAFSRRFLGGEFLPIEWPRVRRLRGAYDVVHFSDLWSAVSPWTVKWMTRHVPVALTLHDTSFFTGGCLYPFGCVRFHQSCGRCPQKQSLGMPIDVTRMAQTIKRRARPKSNFAAIAPSKWMAKQAEDSRFFNQEPRVIYNAADLTVFNSGIRDEARRHHNLSPDQKVVLIAANSLADRRKGAALARDALCLLDDGNIVTLMVGANNAGFSSGLPGRVIQTGHLSDDRSLALAYAAADIYLFPSLADNCPLSVIESLSVGTPVLALQRAGTPELIDHGSTGWLISDPDSAAFASALRTLLGNPALLRQMSVTAAQTAQTRFSLENHGAEVESFYDALIHARNRQL